AMMDVLRRERNLCCPLSLYTQIVAADHQKHQDQERNEYHNYPGSLNKLGGSNDHSNQQRRKCTYSINDHAPLPPSMSASQTPPVTDHASLRQRKRHEDTH